MLQIMAQLNMADRGWLLRQADEATVRLEEIPRDYAAYSIRGLVKLILGSQPAPDMQTLQEAGDDLLAAIALVHDHMPELADPAGGPLQVAHIWDAQEASYSNGLLYTQVFFNQNPQLFPEFAQMLTSWWELQDVMIEIVDDPIIFSVAFSPDGSQIATLSESGPSWLRLWDATTGEMLREVALPLDGRVIATTDGHLAFSPDGASIAVAYTNPVARVIDTRTGDVALELAHELSINSVAWSPDGTQLATVDPDSDAPILWDAASGERVMTTTVESAIANIAFSPDGNLLVGGGETVQLWNAESGDLVTTLPGYDPGYVGAPAVSPDGRLLALPDYPVVVYDLPSASQLYTIPIGARTVAFSPDGSRLATSGFEAAGVWDSETGEMVLLAGNVHGANSVAWSPDGSQIVTGGPDGRFRVWDVETGAELWGGWAATLWWEETITPEPALPATSSSPAPAPIGEGAQRGIALFVGQGCVGCHGRPGQGGIVGPDLAGVATAAAGRDPALTAEEYLRQSIIDAEARLAPLCPDGPCLAQIMPHTYGEILSPAELDDLLAYLMSLG